MNLDLKQAGAVALLTTVAVGLWFAGHRFDMPPEATTPVVLALLGGIVGWMRSYRTPTIPVHTDTEGMH